MKQNVLALSITAALIGLTGSAHAMTGALGGAAGASTLALNGDGIGHILLVPYFSSQNANATLINITNTDTVKGKAVKVRFRGAANSDDIFDFQVFLSPGDVWTASVAQDANGLTRLTTADASCTKPAASVLNNTSFVTTRLDPSMSANQLANGTREGYVEIFNMGDIPAVSAAIAPAFAGDDVIATTAGVAASGAASGAANPLFTAIKHVNKVAPCSGAAWDALDGATAMSWNATASANTPRSFGLLPPTSGLMGNWVIINTVGAAAWSGEAVAIATQSTGNVVYWPQIAVPAATPDLYTADPLLRSTNVYSVVGTTYTADATAAYPAGSYDLPDLSTPYTVAGTTPLAQANSLTAAIEATSATNEYLTTTSIFASTDMVFSMPTRRYSVALDYAAITTVAPIDDGRRFTNLADDSGVFGSLVYFGKEKTTVANSTLTNGNGRQICVTLPAGTPSAIDREETMPTVSSPGVVISPQTPATPTIASLCGEAAVFSINNGGIVPNGTGALKASVAVKDLDVGNAEGWLNLATPGGNTAGLPLLGAAFTRAANGAQTFGVTFKHRFARPAP